MSAAASSTYALWRSGTDAMPTGGRYAGAVKGSTRHRVAPPPGIDLADPGFWRLPEPARLAAFARLRQLDAPVFFPERPLAAAGRTRGFHALVHHRDVVAASRRPDVFTSGHGVTTPRPARWARIVLGDSMVNLDDPRHARLRGIVSRAFTARVVARSAEDISRTAVAIVDDVSAHRPHDFVTSVAAPLPLRVICTMMGIPPENWPAVLHHLDDASEHTAVRSRRIRLPGQGLWDVVRLHRLVGRVARQRRRRPTDDLISALVTADVEGRRLTGRELGSFFSLLLVAGVETTRNAIAHGLRALTTHPEQREILTSDFGRYGDGFVDEVVRYASPIIQFRRTLARDYELNGHQLRAGEDVVLFYASANRDEEVFAHPDTFDITRSPNPHVGFGGGGPHYCLGASLARQEMTVLFRELYTRLPEIRSVEPPELIPSNFDHRVKRLSFTF
jgi:cytochrome P450